MILSDFDPNGPGQDNGNYFGLPFTPEESALVLLSVPWDVTASYEAGARFAPDAIIAASTQLDLYEPLYPHGWRRGIGTVPIEYAIQEVSEFLRGDAVKVMKHLENGGKVSDDYVKHRVEKINEASHELNKKIRRQCMELIRSGKLIGLVGGDHSTPFGLISALAETNPELSILHLDAHCDLRYAYEGFTDSHASIMYNVIDRIPQVGKIVQVGIRDLCDFEAEFAEKNERIEIFFDHMLAGNFYGGMCWEEQCERIIANLGSSVYVSFDIDGLSPDNSPNTGTPVPGGMSFHQSIYLINKVVESGKRIVGFDLCEVSPRVGQEWDANVGARILYKLSNLTLKTNEF